MNIPTRNIRIDETRAQRQSPFVPGAIKVRSLECASPTPEAIDRYLRLARWAQRRYTVQHRLVLRIGDRLSRYSRIERLAFDRYMQNGGLSDDRPFRLPAADRGQVGASAGDRAGAAATLESWAG